MQNYKNSDYALNKHSKGIVYRFNGMTVEITLEAFLAENPDKTAADFKALKELSDADYLERDRSDYRQTWKDVSADTLLNAEASTTLSPETVLFELPEIADQKRKRLTLALKVWDKLTEVQRRRYWMYHAKGLTEEKIAEKEGATQQAVSKSLLWTEKKIKKYFSASKK